MGKTRKNTIEETYEEVEKDILGQANIEDIEAQVNSAKKLSRQRAKSLLVQLSGLKGSISQRTFKQIRNKIVEKLQEEEIQAIGPKISENDLVNLQRKISSFFKSGFAKEFPENEKISFYLSGSLVSGFSKNKNNSFFNQPSDKGRVSDVDILVFISSKLFNSIFTDPKLVEKHLGHKRTFPIGTEEKFSQTYAGIFSPLLEDLSKLSIASRQRHVNFTFFEHSILDIFEKTYFVKILNIVTL